MFKFLKSKNKKEKDWLNNLFLFYNCFKDTHCYWHSNNIYIYIFLTLILKDVIIENSDYKLIKFSNKDKDGDRS